MLMNTHEQFGVVSRLLHWVIFALVAGMILGGMLLNILPVGGVRSFVISVHKSAGALILILMLVRLAWRNINPAPKPLGSNPLFNYAAHLLHIVLYILLIVQPLSGILMSQAYGHPVGVFGWFTLPRLVWHSPSLGAFFSEVHATAATILAIAIFVHAGAALKHHHVDGDRTLMRMLKG
jgi:cytochrome b561